MDQGKPWIVATRCPLPGAKIIDSAGASQDHRLSAWSRACCRPRIPAQGRKTMRSEPGHVVRYGSGPAPGGLLSFFDARSKNRTRGMKRKISPWTFICGPALAWMPRVGAESAAYRIDPKKLRVELGIFWTNAASMNPATSQCNLQSSCSAGEASGGTSRGAGSKSTVPSGFFNFLIFREGEGKTPNGLLTTLRHSGSSCESESADRSLREL
jgi:hypothetical protein